MSYKISRRSFLKVTALTAAAVAVAGVTTGCSVTPYEPQCTKNGANPVQFGDFTIEYSHATLTDMGDDNIEVTFFVTNNSDNDLTIYASDFRCYCEANGLGELQATEVSVDISDTTKTVVPAKASRYLNVKFKGVKGKDDYPLTVKLHRGTYSLKYLVAGGEAALVTPQPYFELVW